MDFNLNMHLGHKQAASPPNPPAPPPPPPSAYPTYTGSHQYVYKPVPCVSAESNPWTNPQPYMSFNMTHECTTEARPHYRQPEDAQNPWIIAQNNSQQSADSTNPWIVAQSHQHQHAAAYNPWTIPQPHYKPDASPTPMHYPGQSSIQFFSSYPTAEPSHVNHYYGATQTQVNAQNIKRAQAHGAYGQYQMVPQPASPDNEFYCRELDGTYTLRTMNTIMQSLQPGVWQRSTSGYPYFVRTK